MSTIRWISFPRTEPPPQFIPSIIDVFVRNEASIATLELKTHLKSDQVLAAIRDGLAQLGFEVEGGKKAAEKISRPVFFGEQGEPTLRFEVDAYHEAWRCGMEVEATRAIRGGAVYRDLIQALVMVQVDHLCIAVPNLVRFGVNGRSKAFEESLRTIEALFGHSRVRIPYGLTLIGY